MTRQYLSVLFAVFAVLLLSGEVDAAESDRLPNIVIIMADDLGYGDVSCFGATKIKTPHIDRLAKQGMRFTDAHTAASVCSPSRYGLMTGKYPWRLHKKGNGYKLDPSQSTVASFLQKQNYQSAAIGKWHLGYGKDWEHPLKPGPLEVGFDFHFGVPTNHNDKYRAFVENHQFYGLKKGESLRLVKGRDFPEGLEKPRVEDQVDSTLTKKSIQFIRENADKPFFLYFTPCCPHTHITPAGNFRGTSEAGLLGDYIQELDSHVGEIVATLEELGLTEDTLLFFTSDNGNSPKDFKGTQNMKLNLADDSGDIREKFKTAKADARKLGHFTNGPWRDGKGTPFEGGHRVPFIARWPGRIPASTESGKTICLTDLFATIADVVEKDLPENSAEDSISFASMLFGKAEKDSGREFTFIQGDTKDNAIAVRYRNWKLIRSRLSPTEMKYELYDLSKDRSESNDISGDHAEIVLRMSRALEEAENDGRTRLTSGAAPFVHPGISHNAKAIQRIKTRLAKNEQPWANAWSRLNESRYANQNWIPRPRVVVERGSYNNPDIGSSEFLQDGTAAYTLALKWVLDGDEKDAGKSAAILDAWAETLKEVKNHDARLLIGMAGLKYCNAAELLKHSWDGWPESNQKQFEKMLREVWYPVIKDFYPTANGNWDASMLQTMIAIGVFLNDREIFDRAVNYYRNGRGNGAIGNYFNEFGECQESGRDQAHTQMGLEFLANTCEIAWNQNVDLYAELDNRLLKGFEYTAKYNLGNSVPYEPFKSVGGRYNYESISSNSRGRLRPMYKRVLNHFHYRKGMDAPYTEQAANKSRRRSRSSSTALPWESLMFGNR